MMDYFKQQKQMDDWAKHLSSLMKKCTKEEKKCLHDILLLRYVEELFRSLDSRTLVEHALRIARKQKHL